MLLPLLTEGHAHQTPATDWWVTCDDGNVALTLLVRMALLRLLSNSRVMGSGTLRPTQAWGAVQRLVDDPRVSVIDQVPSSHATPWLGNVTRREPTPNLWRDAWLAALAQANDCEMVTFDRGFRSFPKLKLRLLEPAR
ncbi:MAG: TA system VapC family ribonuclease toxin [Variovorax sp.]